MIRDNIIWNEMKKGALCTRSFTASIGDLVNIAREMLSGYLRPVRGHDYL